jgi:hypothetical protein
VLTENSIRGRLESPPTAPQKLAIFTSVHGSTEYQNLNLEDKFKIIVGLLWKLPAFKSQGQPIAWNTLQHKFQSILKSFRVKHGFGDDGQSAIISALPEDSSELEGVLMAIHRLAARKEEDDLKEKQTNEESTKVLSNVTDAITSGGGVKGLHDLSAETASTSNSSSSSGVRDFAAMSKIPKNNKRVISQVETEAATEMQKICDLRAEEAARVKAEDAERVIERAEAKAERAETKAAKEELKKFFQDARN